MYQSDFNAPNGGFCLSDGGGVATAPNYLPSSNLEALFSRRHPRNTGPVSFLSATLPFPTHSQNPPVPALRVLMRGSHRPGRPPSLTESPVVPPHLFLSRSFGLPRSRITRAVDTWQVDSKPLNKRSGEFVANTVGLFSPCRLHGRSAVSCRSGHPGLFVLDFAGVEKSTVFFLFHNKVWKQKKSINLRFDLRLSGEIKVAKATPINFLNQSHVQECLCLFLIPCASPSVLPQTTRPLLCLQKGPPAAPAQGFTLFKVGFFDS